MLRPQCQRKTEPSDYSQTERTKLAESAHGDGDSDTANHCKQSTAYQDSDVAQGVRPPPLTPTSHMSTSLTSIASFLSPPPAHASGKATEVGPGAPARGQPVSHVSSGWSSGLLAVAWPNPGCCHLESESTDRRFLFIFQIS